MHIITHRRSLNKMRNTEFFQLGFEDDLTSERLIGIILRLENFAVAALTDHNTNVDIV